MNRKLIVALFAVAVVAGLCVFLFRGAAPEGARGTASGRAPVADAQPEAVRSAPVTDAGSPAAEKKPRPNGWAAALGTNRLAAAERALKLRKVGREPTEREEKLVERAHDLASAEDVAGARKFAAAQLMAEHPKVREAAVFALANCGTPCLAELTPFLADPDEGVRAEAAAAWHTAWFELPAGQLKVDAAVAVMCTLDDEAALEPIASELIKTKDEDLAAALAFVLENGTEAGKAAASRIGTARGVGVHL